MSRFILDQLDEAEKAATQGPWEFKASLYTQGNIWIPTEGDLFIQFPHTNTTADTEIICLMRNNIRGLIDVARAAEGIVKDGSGFVKYHDLHEALSKLRGDE